MPFYHRIVHVKSWDFYCMVLSLFSIVWWLELLWTPYLSFLGIQTLADSMYQFYSSMSNRNSCLFELSFGILTAHFLFDLFKICIGSYRAPWITHHSVIGLHLARGHGYLMYII